MQQNYHIRGLQISVGAWIFISLCLFISTGDAQDRTAQEIFTDATPYTHVFLVQTTLETDFKGEEKPLLQFVYVQQGRVKPQPVYPHERSRSLHEYRIEILGRNARMLYSMPFEYTRSITVPPAKMRADSPSGPDRIDLKQARAFVVLPFRHDAVFIRVRGTDLPPRQTMFSLEHAIHSRIHPSKLVDPGQSPDFSPFHLRSAAAGSFPADMPSTMRAPAHPGTFHVLLLASGYFTTTMSTFYHKAQQVQQALSAVKPFSTHLEDIAFHAYGNTSDLGCAPGCWGIDRLLCCNSNNVMAAAAVSGYYYDEIIVIHNTSTYSGGGTRDLGAYQTNSYSTYAVVYSGTSMPVMALHEFGHSFGNLCDEYKYDSEPYTYQPCVNCRTDCTIWNGLIDSCYQSCDAEPSYYRPDNSVMRSLSYNTFNEVSIQLGLIPRLLYFTANIQGTSYLLWTD